MDGECRELKDEDVLPSSASANSSTPHNRQMLETARKLPFH